ncbi:protein BCCIP homolog isoform X2 [Salvia splendens]|uniref:protein BCCIP homolog isoform X2 n=1 Tax=Salvia splendens TaxID=180675 RepID=UPI001C271D14|nr:protein BCCIP homolog isoform X2 [Salvia splendens]
MPRKPKKNNRLVTFSPFGRSIAMATRSWRATKEVEKPERQNKDLATSSLNGFKDNIKDKIQQSDSSDDEEFEGDVQADFVFFDPKPDDFHGVKLLLQTYLDNLQWDLSGFVDLILGQPTVGTVVKIENDEDDGVYSVVSALNLGRYKDSKCVLELKDFLLKVCQDMYVLGKLKSLVGEHVQHVGLLVSQRVVNLPPQLLPPLYDGLFEEVEWATEDEPTKELQSSFRFRFYLIISKIYKHKNADQNRGTLKNGEESVIYNRPEDEIFFELSSWSFSFRLHAQQVTANEGHANWQINHERWSNSATSFQQASHHINMYHIRKGVNIHNNAITFACV